MIFCNITPAKAQIAMPDTVCTGTSRVYRVNDATVPSTYTWMIDGVTQPATGNQLNVTWNREGSFLITVQEHSQAGCDGDIRSGWVHVFPAILANAGPDATICFGTPYRLNGSGGATYQWLPPTYLSNPNISNPVADIPKAGTYIYILRVSGNNVCSATDEDSVTLTVLPPARVSAGRDTSLSLGQSLQLEAVDLSNSRFNSYRWSPASYLNNPAISNPVATPRSNITYNLTAGTIDGCEATSSITIKVFAKPDIFVPNAFTPNGDGLNDQLKAIPVGIVQFKYFKVFNRWGEMVFSTADPQKGWDGIYKGQMQNGGNYTWITEGVDYTGNVIQKKGYAVLIR